MTQQPESTTHFILDARQGGGGADGWQVGELSNLQIAAEGLRLAYAPEPPVPLKDAAGTFGGLENPSGVAVGPNGTIYVSDAAQHLVYRIIRREGLRTRARFFRVGGGRFAGARFVYVPTANRVELWPRELRRDPQSFKEVEVVCETVWNEAQARQLILSYAGGGQEHARGACCEACASKGGGCGCGGARVKTGGGGCGCEGCTGAGTEEAASIEKEWADAYPQGLPAGEACQTSIEYLSCLGGFGDAPRQLDEPRGLAIAKGSLYVADTRNHRVQVFALGSLALRAVWGRRAGAAEVEQGNAPAADCVPDPAQAVRAGQPIAGGGPGQFKEPWDVVADARGNVYVADRGNQRVQKFERRTRRFQVFDGTVLKAHFFKVLYGPSQKDRHVYVPARRRLERWPHALGHDPASVAEVDFIADNISSLDDARRRALEAINAVGARDRLAEWEGAYPPALAAAEPEPAFGSPTHLAFDKQGRLFVVDDDKDYVKILDAEGRVVGRVEFTEEVGGLFKPSAVAVDAEGKLLLAGQGGVHRFNVEGARSFYDAFYAAWRGRCEALVVGGAGEVLGVGGKEIGVAELKPPRAFVREGAYLSRALDSRIENCRWHKIVFARGFQIPHGTSVNVRTYTSAEALTPVEVSAVGDEEWRTNQTNADNFLVLSGPGRYLWLKIELRGNGVETPTLGGLRAHFPRVTYLEYLPAVYQADPVSRDFLERFLSIFENIFAGMEASVASASQLFDADGSPAEAPHDFLTWLAGWVDMTFAPGWTVETRRNLLRHAPELYRLRGTPAGLKLLVRLTLGVEVRVVEHFRLRRWLLPCGDSATLGDRSALWGNCVVSRLQLDEYASVGDFALTNLGDPLRDPFSAFAHKFSVYVQASDVRQEATGRMLRHLIEREKPAHTAYELVEVEPRFRVGMQSTLGLDTQVGAYPRLVLNHCSTLGYDTLLGCDGSEGVALQVGSGVRVGVGAVVG